MTKSNFLIVYQDCRIVEGFLNALIYDLTRPKNSNVIPKSLVQFIRECANTPLEVVIDRGSKEEKIIMLEYVEFLIKNDFAHIGDEHLRNQLRDLTFPENLHPEKIYDAILCVNETNFNDAIQLIQLLDELACQHIEFRIDSLRFEQLEKIIDTIKDGCLKTVLMRFDYSKGCVPFFTEMIKREPRLRNVIIYNGTKSASYNQIEVVTDSVDFINDCGEISQTNFSLNLRFFTESQSCNTCLSKKLSLDFEGNLKNCPSQSTTFGTLSSTSVRDLIQSREFKKLGGIRKDEIEICKDCIYRHMCLDCRVFTDIAGDTSRPSKCEYNPYIEKWKSDEGYEPVENCGSYNSDGIFELNQEKITKLNLELWGE